MATILLMPSRMPGRWQVAVSLLLLGFVLCVTLAWASRANAQISLARLTLVVVMIAVFVMSASTIGERITVIRGDLAILDGLRKDVQGLGPTGLHRLRSTDFTSAIKGDTPFGPGWVYLSNLNAVDGGPVWRAFSRM